MRAGTSIPRRAASAGFTLIEVLVGLVLLSAFLGGIYTVAVGTIQAKRVIDRQAMVYTAGPEILDLIERDLRGAFLSAVKDRKGFVGRRESVGGVENTYVDLVTTTDSKVSVELDQEFHRSDVTEIGYRLRPSDEFSGLLELYRREEIFFDDEPLKGGQYYLVYDRLVSLVMEFFEKPEEGETTSSFSEEEGKEEWDSEKEQVLPYAVKVTLTVAAPVERGQDPDKEPPQYTFVRWILMSSAYDEVPKQEGEGDGGPRGG